MSDIQANIKDKEGNEKGTEIEKNAKNKKDKENAQKSLTDINNEKKKTIHEISKLNVKDYEKIYLIEKEKYARANLLRIFIDNSVLPIIVNKNDLEISLDIVPLIEYNYFILIPFSYFEYEISTSFAPTSFSKFFTTIRIITNKRFFSSMNHNMNF